MSLERLSLEASWEWLRAQGYEPPVVASGQPFIPDHMPSYDDEQLGLEFFRTILVDETLADLTLPRTFFGQSEFQRVSFCNTDLTESRLCWNDWVECDFTQAILTHADLRASEFVRCRFEQADLLVADLRWSSFAECEFTGARMQGARLTHQQGADLALSEAQRAQIDWQDLDGPEPPGG